MKDILSLLSGSQRWEEDIIPGVQKLSKQDFFPGVTGYYHPVDGVSPVLSLNASLWVGALAIISIINNPQMLHSKDATHIFNKLFPSIIPLLERGASLQVFHNGQLWKIFIVPSAQNTEDAFTVPHSPIEEVLSEGSWHASPTSKSPRFSMHEAEGYVKQLMQNGVSSRLIRAVGQTTMEISSKLVGVPYVQSLFIGGTMALLLNNCSHADANEFQVKGMREDGKISMIYGMVEGVKGRLAPEPDDIIMQVRFDDADAQEKVQEIMKYMDDDKYILVSKENEILKNGDIPHQVYRFRLRNEEPKEVII